MLLMVTVFLVKGHYLKFFFLKNDSFSVNSLKLLEDNFCISRVWKTLLYKHSVKLNLVTNRILNSS